MLNMRRTGNAWWKATLGGAALAIIVLGSAVYACTLEAGKMEVQTGEVNGSVINEALFTGHGSSCYQAGAADIDDASSTGVTVIVAPSSISDGNCINGNKLANREHTIRWVTGTFVDDGADCMTSGTPIGAITPDSSGNATSQSNSFTPASALGRISICVDDTVAGVGNQVPLTII